MGALVSGSRADITCDDCLTFGGNMLDYLMSAESIAEQIEIINANVCPGAEDPAGCEAGIRAWWEGIAMAMYPVFLEPNSVCGELGACMIKNLVGEPTCDECTGSVAAVAALIGSEEKIAEVIAFLNGDGFCEPALTQPPVTPPLKAPCPMSCPSLAAVLEEGAEGYCCDLSSTGVCC